MTSERFDHTKIEQGVRLLLEGIGEDPERPGLRETPSRVARMYAEIFAGIAADAANVVTVVEGADFDEMIMVRDIPLYSVCEHHLLPFVGKAHVAYIPNKSQQITGLSKVARAVPHRRADPPGGDGSHPDALSSVSPTRPCVPVPTAEQRRGPRRSATLP